MAVITKKSLNTHILIIKWTEAPNPKAKARARSRSMLRVVPLSVVSCRYFSMHSFSRICSATIQLSTLSFFKKSLRVCESQTQRRQSADACARDYYFEIIHTVINCNRYCYMHYFGLPRSAGRRDAHRLLRECVCTLHSGLRNP